jgi:hypothetical protein
LKDELHKRTSWLDALKSMDVGTTGKAEIAEDSTSPFEDEISGSLIQRGAKSAKREKEGLLSLLSLRHSRNSENRALRPGYRTKGNPTRERPWLDALTSLEGKSTAEETDERYALCCE